MSLNTTTLSAACGINDTSITVASATGFAAGNVVIVEKERMRVQKGYATGTSIPVLRGQDGTATYAHNNSITVEVGVAASDWPISSPTTWLDGQQVIGGMNSVYLTATGATGSTATQVPTAYPAMLAVTGTSGAGINLQTGAAIPGAFYIVRNGTTGALNVYSVGATINGTTGTTAAAITATGNKAAIVWCDVPNAWQLAFNT